MSPDEVLTQTPTVLSRYQQEFYFNNGYLIVERALGGATLKNLREAAARSIEASRQIVQSDTTWDLEPGHNSNEPRLRRLTSPNDYDEDFWHYASSSFITDLLADLIGPNIKFHHSKLNFKWSGGGEEVRWHQDIGFWPHTNFTPCTVGLYLQDCDDDQGPLGVVAESHRGPLFDQYDEEGNWRGCLSDEDTKRLNPSKIVYLPAPSGSITIHNCRTVHGSRRNVSESPRPLLLNAYSAADAMPYTAVPTPSKYYQQIVRGSGSRWARHEPGLCLMPPDWSGGYRSIFALQQRENLDG